MEDKTVSILKIIGYAVVIVLASWLLRAVIGILTWTLLGLLSVIPFALDFFMAIITLGDGVGAWSSYMDWITGLNLENSWIFWDVLIGISFLFFYVMGGIKSDDWSLGSPKSQPEHIKTIHTLDENSNEDKWVRRYRRKQAKKNIKQDLSTNNTSNKCHYIDEKNNWLTNTPTRWQSIK